MNWTKQADCSGLDVSWFFERYEADPQRADEIDEICFSCPVQQECIEFALNTNATGCFGGIYFVLGKYSKTRNAHKSKYVENKLKQMIAELNV